MFNARLLNNDELSACIKFRCEFRDWFITNNTNSLAPELDANMPKDIKT